MERTKKLQLLNSIFNECNQHSLKSLSRPIYPSVLIFKPQGGRLLFNGRLNPLLPAKYQGKIMEDKELDSMLFAGGNPTTFLLPDNGRD